MVRYLLSRFIYMVVLLVVVSMVAFFLIELPPGDYVTAYLTRLEQSGTMVTDAQAVALRERYGLGSPGYIRYLKWIGRIMQGDFGRSFMWNKPVRQLLAERLPFTITISLATLLFTYVVSIPIGIYSATHQYSVGDYFFTVVGFGGLAIPNFLLALILMTFLYGTFGVSIGGLVSPEYRNAAFSLGKLWDVLKHLPVPVIVVGTAGTAALIRVMRNSLLDELKKQYVVTARAKGVQEKALLFRYPVRVAINPIISTVGWILPQIISGGTITAIVLNLPTVGPVLFQSLMMQDMYLAGSIVMILSFLTIVGTLLSDILLAATDPRIRFEKQGQA